MSFRERQLGVEDSPLGGPALMRDAFHAAAATAFPLATEAAVDILRAGGNAVDAAVAAAWALSVCEPSASGLGGQTTMLVHTVDGNNCVIDGSSRAPAAASLRTIDKDQQRRGRRSSTVPSTAATLHYAQSKYGVLRAEDVMAPAIRIAEEGYPITDLQHRQLRWVARYLRESPSAELFLRDGLPPPVGFLFRQNRLAATLRRLAEFGVADFYRGGVAELIVADMRRHGGLIAEDDLLGCAPVEREPLSIIYQGHRILTVPPPGGGLELLMALKILDRLASETELLSDDAWYENIALATFAAFRERERRPVEPDDFTVSRLPAMLSDENVRQIATELRDGPAFFPNEAEEPGDTTHLSVADRRGNMVLLTQSIQSVFGAKVAHPQLGFVYNNYLCTCPRYPHPYGLRGRCRPRSNAAPTLALRAGSGGEAPYLGLGAAGSRRIISAILQIVSCVIDRRFDLASAVAAPRVHALLNGKVWIERPAASTTLLARLQARSFQPIVKSPNNYAMGSVQAIQVSPDGKTLAAADPRRDGAATAFC